MQSTYDVSRMPIRLWADDDRPREKLIKKGKSSLSDAELLAILLGSGSRDESVVELAKRILLSAGNNLNKLGKLGLNDLCQFKGMGPVKAITLMAALEMGRRRKESDTPERKTILNSRDAFEYIEPVMTDLPHEEFWIIFTNRTNGIVGKKQVSAGGIVGTVADVRLVFKYALDAFATGIIVCHNHPSGSLKPSDTDIRLTRQMADAGRVMEISLLDHLIVADRKYFSFKDEGML